MDQEKELRDKLTNYFADETITGSAKGDMCEFIVTLTSQMVEKEVDELSEKHCKEMDTAFRADETNINRMIDQLLYEHGNDTLAQLNVQMAVKSLQQYKPESIQFLRKLIKSMQFIFEMRGRPSVTVGEAFHSYNFSNRIRRKRSHS